jgi:hypothetical protein
VLHSFVNNVFDSNDVIMFGDQDHAVLASTSNSVSVAPTTCNLALGVLVPIHILLLVAGVEPVPSQVPYSAFPMFNWSDVLGVASST